LDHDRDRATPLSVLRHARCYEIMVSWLAHRQVYATPRAAARPAARPEKIQPPRNVPSSAA
jgi:hypothetical protein